MGNQKITPTNFIATVYGNLTPLNNSAFSKARLKIFYKGLNRNGSYITDEVAEQLMSTLPGTPIVGCFNGEKDDFEGHKPWSPEDLKAYGFVPQDMNFKWEMSLDPDGVYRTYACADIVLWTGRYPVASRIVGKSHSMELNPNTIEGEWVETEEDFYYQFSNAEFFGLCILGDEYEPCFEGSSFYELKSKNEEDQSISQELQEMFSLYKKGLDIADENQTGGQEMEDEIKDSVVEEVKEEEVPTTNELDQEEEVSEEVKEDNEVEEKEEDSDVEENDEEEDSKSDEEEAEEESEDEVEEEESEEPETDHTAPEETEEEDSEEDKEEDSEETEEQEESEEEPDLNSQLAEKDAEIASLKAQLEELSSYKAQKVREEKEQIIDAYAKKLTDEEEENFRSRIDEFESAIELKKEIALCVLDKEDESAEEADESSNFSLVNKREKLNGVEAILARHCKKN